MKLNLTAVRKASNKALFAVAKNSPLIITAASIIGFGATTFLAVKASKKVSEKMDDIEKRQEDRKKWEETKKEYEASNLEVPDSLLENEPETVKTSEIIKTVAFHYGPAVAVGIASTAGIFFAHFMMQNRINELVTMSAVSTLQYNTLVKRIEKEYGPEKARELQRGAIVTEKAQGRKPAKVVKDEDTDANGHNKYLGFWFSQSEHYAKDALDYNLQYLREIDNRVCLYLNTHPAISINKLLGSKFFAVNDRSADGACRGYTLGTWNSFLDTPPEVVSITDPDTGTEYYDIWVALPAPKYIYDIED